MNRLILHISYLLLENEYLVIPQIGGFIVREKEAWYNHTSGVMHKPSVSISFNESLQHNDGLLTQSYSRQLGVPLSQAEKILNNDISVLKQLLDSGETVVLDDWGTLYKDGFGCTIFKPSEHVSILRPHLWGLNDITLAPLSTTSNSLFTPKNTSRRGKRNLFVIATGVAACLFALTFSTPLWQGEEGWKDYAGFVWKSSTMEHASTNRKIFVENPPNSLPATAVEESVNNEPTSSRDSENKQNDTITIDADAPFLLVVGSCYTSTTAEKIAGEFRKNGFEQVSIDHTPTIKRVYVQEFHTQKEAQEALKTFHEATGYTDAWIYHRPQPQH